MIIIIALLEIEYPPKVEAFFQGFEFASLNIPSDWNLVQKYMPEEDKKASETDERFQEYGFESAYVIAQEILFYTILAVSFVIFVVVLTLVLFLCLSKEKKTKLKTKLRTSFRGFVIRILMEFYVPLFISLFLNIKFFNFNSIFGLCSFSLAFLMTVVLCFIPVYYTRVLVLNRHRLEEEDFKTQYGAFYEGLKLDRLSSILFF